MATADACLDSPPVLPSPRQPLQRAGAARLVAPCAEARQEKSRSQRAIRSARTRPTFVLTKLATGASRSAARWPLSSTAWWHATVSPLRPVKLGARSHSRAQQTWGRKAFVGGRWKGGRHRRHRGIALAAEGDRHATLCVSTLPSRRRPAAGASWHHRGQLRCCRAACARRVERSHAHHSSRGHIARRRPR